MFSSFQVIESAYTHSSKRLRSQITQKAFMKVWKATGEAIDSEMRERNGVVVPGFGTFTYRANGQPCFILSNTFARQSRAQQAKPPVPGKSVSHKLNLSRVASIAGVEKHVAGDTIDCIARHCASLVNKTRGKDDLRISFHPVAELTFSKMKASIKFVTSFLSRLGKVPLTVGHLARHTARYSKGRGNGGTSVRSGATPRSNTSFAQNVANAAALAPSDVSSVVTDHYNDENAGRDIVDKIKKAIIRRAGSDGIQAVSRVLRLMDDSDDKRLSKSELKYGLRDFGIDLSSDQLNRVMQYFDRNNDGSISFDEFLRGLAPPMSDRRLSFVHQAFNILDNTGDGLVTIDDLANAYDVSWHPDVKEGTTEPVKVLRKFLDTFDSDEKDGIITIEEFEKYYENVSASIDDDEYFELMMRNAWHIDGGEGVAANTTNKRVLVTGNDGKQRVETVRNDLGMKRNSVSSARRRMREQGTKNVASVDLYGGFEKKNGARRDGSRGGGRRSSGGQNQSYEANTKSSANRYAESIDSNRPDGWCSGDNNDKEALPPNAPSTSSMKPPSDPETLAWNTLRRLLFTPPIPLIAMQQKLEMCVAIGTDQLLETSFQSKLSALHTKDQSKRKRNGDSPAPALSRSELRYISKMVAKLGGDSGYIDLSNLHKELVTFFGTRGSKPSNGQNFGSKSVIDRVRKKIVSSGGAGGIAALMRVLKVMDSSGDDALSRDELKAGLLDLGIDVSLSDMENLMIYFDRDHNGTISFAEFCDGIRGNLSEKRMSMVTTAFNSVEDPIGSGVTTFDTLETEISQNNKYSNELLDELDHQLEDQGEGGSATISLSDFIDYYRTLSAAVDSDRKFESILTSTYPNADLKPVPVVSKRKTAARQPTRQGSRGGSRGSNRRSNTTKEVDALARFRKNKKRPDLANQKGIVRLKAAAHLQAVFRGHKGRRKVEYERRKREQKELKEKQEREEREAASRRIVRTQPKHNPRFQAARR